MEEQQERQPLLDSSDVHTRDANGIRKQSVVSFQEDEDSENPLEWSKKYKWFSVALFCSFAAVVTYTCIGIVPVLEML